MTQEAKVSSVLVLQQLRASLGTFAGTASAALDEASTEIQRTCRWLTEDRYRHWKIQVQVRREQFARAKIALKGREVLDRTLAGTPSSCVDERKALKVADARLREAEHKFQRVKAWSLRIEKEMSDYRGTVQQLVEAIEVEIPNARAKLDKMIGSLEAYLALAPPEMPRTTDDPEGRRAEGGSPRRTEDQTPRTDDRGPMTEPSSAVCLPSSRPAPRAGAEPGTRLESEIRNPKSEIEEAP